MLSKYEIKYIYTYLDLDTLNSFIITNKNYNKDVNRYIKKRLINNIKQEYTKLINYRFKLLDNYDVIYELIKNKHLNIIKYLKYYNKNNRNIIKLLDKEKNYHNIYDKNIILLLIKYFCLNYKEENIKKYIKIKLNNYLQVASNELNDSVTDRLGINNAYINSIYFYINIYKNKEVYKPLIKNNYIYLGVSWRYIYDIINKTIFT